MPMVERLEKTRARKVWQQVDRLIEDFTKAKTHCGPGNNPAAKAKRRQVRARIRGMTSPEEELSAVARWCRLVRNDRQLSRRVG